MGCRVGRWANMVGMGVDAVEGAEYGVVSLGHEAGIGDAVMVWRNVGGRKGTGCGDQLEWSFGPAEVSEKSVQKYRDKGRLTMMA